MRLCNRSLCVCTPSGASSAGHFFLDIQYKPHEATATAPMLQPGRRAPCVADRRSARARLANIRRAKLGGSQTRVGGPIVEPTDTAAQDAAGAAEAQRPSSSPPSRNAAPQRVTSYPRRISYVASTAERDRSDDHEVPRLLRKLRRMLSSNGCDLQGATELMVRHCDRLSRDDQTALVSEGIKLGNPHVVRFLLARGFRGTPANLCQIVQHRRRRELFQVHPIADAQMAERLRLMCDRDVRAWIAAQYMIESQIGAHACKVWRSSWLG